MSDTSTMVPTADPKAVAQATAVIGAVGTWSEWMTEHADAYFVTMIDQVTTALATVAPSVTSAYGVWSAEHPTWERKRFTATDWVTAVGNQRGEAWEIDSIDLARLTIPFGLALWGHTTGSMAHYLKVCTNDLTGTYGVRDIDGYLAWLPKRSEYQMTNDKGKRVDIAVRSQEAIDADEAKSAATKAKVNRKAEYNLTGYVWDTIADPKAFATTKDYVKRLVALEHDFSAFVASQVAALGDEGKSAKREIAKQVSDATKPKATPRASK
jgi:hypothetical protein